MAEVIQHVRFKLTDLVRAAQAAQDSNQRPSTQEALSYYWNWATSRGWFLVAVANQMDPHSAVISLENTK